MCIAVAVGAYAQSLEDLGCQFQGLEEGWRAIALSMFGRNWQQECMSKVVCV